MCAWDGGVRVCGKLVLKNLMGLRRTKDASSIATDREWGRRCQRDCKCSIQICLQLKPLYVCYLLVHLCPLLSSLLPSQSHTRTQGSTPENRRIIRNARGSLSKRCSQALLKLVLISMGVAIKRRSHGPWK